MLGDEGTSVSAIHSLCQVAPGQDILDVAFASILLVAMKACQLKQHSLLPEPPSEIPNLKAAIYRRLPLSWIRLKDSDGSSCEDSMLQKCSSSSSCMSTHENSNRCSY